MVDIPRSSFIPKDTSGAVPNRIRRKRTFSVFSFLATTILVGSIAFAGGAFFYGKTVDNQLIAEKQKLAEQKGLFNEDQITEVRIFDRKLRAASYLLGNHIAPTKIFQALGKDTKQRIQFTNFLFEYDPGFDIKLTLQGGTKEFKTVALQSLQFGKNPLLKDVTINEIGANDVSSESKTGSTISAPHEVSFGITGLIDIKNIRYDGIGNTIPQQQAQTTREPSSGDMVDIGTESITNELI